MQGQHLSFCFPISIVATPDPSRPQGHIQAQLGLYHPVLGLQAVPPEPGVTTSSGRLSLEDKGELKPCGRGLELLKEVGERHTDDLAVL